MNNKRTETPSVSSSSCSTSSSSSSSDGDFDKMRNEKNQIVKLEIEAAEALAGLAHSSSVIEVDTDNLVSDPKAWPAKGERGWKRVASGNSSPNFDMNTPKLNIAAAAAATARSLDLVQGQSPPEQQQREELCSNVKVKTVKAEKFELQISPMCGKSRGSFFSIKSRQNLSEAAQEERRIHRILANRESARKTIRRRQAVCDELTRKAADLSSENATLKKKKELAEKEYASLRNMNGYLKEQMVVPMNLVQVDNSIEQASPHPNTAASSSTDPSLLLCNPSQFLPFASPLIINSASSLQLPEEHIFSSVIQPSAPDQLQLNSQNTIIFSPRVVNVAGNANSYHEQANPSNFNSSATPICLLPCQWVLPLVDPGIGHELHHHPSLVKRKQDEITTNTTNTGCSSSHALSHILSDKESRPAYNLNETPCDGAVQEEAHSNGTFFKPAIPSSVIPTFSTTQQNGISRGLLSNGATPSTNCHSGSPLPIRNGAPLVYSNKTPVEVVAAAEARKRRKEVTRLKNIRPFRINS